MNDLQNFSILFPTTSFKSRLFQNFKFRRALAAGIMNEGESRLNE